MCGCMLNTNNVMRTVMNSYIQLWMILAIYYCL